MMEGHALYVWGSYALGVLVIGWLILDTLRRHRQARAAVAELEAQRPRRRGTA